MTTALDTGGLLLKDPADERVIQFSWTLTQGATITTSSFTVTAIRPSTSDTALTVDQENTPSNGYVRVNGGTVGQLYEVANTIVTDETPAQTFERSIYVQVENL